MQTETSILEPALAPSSDLSWRERREWLRGWLLQRIPPGITAEEIRIHFSAMPQYYWEHVTEHDLAWGLETIHGFFKLIASPHGQATAPFISWRQITKPRCTRVMLCTWDRQGLLAKGAAAFSAARLSILQAKVYTRSDNVVLDEFTITHVDGLKAVHETRLREMQFLLEGALSEPPRFASLWACCGHKFVDGPSHIVPRITFDANISPDSTMMHVEAADRLGLLHDILHAVTEAGLNIRQATIETEGELARDSIHVTDEQGQKVLDPHRLEVLRAKLLALLAPSD